MHCSFKIQLSSRTMYTYVHYVPDGVDIDGDISVQSARVITPLSAGRKQHVDRTTKN